MGRQGTVFKTIEDGLRGGVGAERGFRGFSGGADGGASFTGEDLTVAGGLGVAGGYACGGFSGTAVGGACILPSGFGGGILSATAIAMGGQTLVYLLLPGGSGLLWIFQRLCGATRRFSQNLIPFRDSTKLPFAGPVAGNSS
jgi:hypothetical protein